MIVVPIITLALALAADSQPEALKRARDRHRELVLRAEDLDRTARSALRQLRKHRTQARRSAYIRADDEARVAWGDAMRQRQEIWKIEAL